MALKPRRNAIFCILFCNDARKTLAGTKNKKTKHNLTKHWHGPKKAKSKKQKKRFPTYGDPESWVDDGILLFCFFWCLSGFGASSVFFWCLSMFGGFDLSKHWQAPNKPKTAKSHHLLGTLDPHRLEIFVFLVLLFAFFWCLPMFCDIMLCFFCACAGLMGLFDVEKERTYSQCFVLIFMQESRPHGPQRKSPETVGKSCFAKWPFQSSLAR